MCGKVEKVDKGQMPLNDYTVLKILFFNFPKRALVHFPYNWKAQFDQLDIV